MSRRPPLPSCDDAACVICGPCRFAKLGLIPGRACANGQDCGECRANREITARCLALDPGFFDRPSETQAAGFGRIAADLLLRYTCNICELICPELAITSDPETGRRRIDPEYCKSCGLCVHYCPNQAMKFS
jgi:Pyruvate/2-oxoacid:ferredoxin oxidoreductase delta subunit